MRNVLFINPEISLISEFNTRKLIEKSLQLGEISLGEYYIELRLYYESIDKLLEMEHTLNKAWFELLKFQ